MLDLHGIFADDKVAKIEDAGHSGLGFALERPFAPADEALVGLELHENVRAVGLRGQRNAEDFEVSDFQTRVQVAKSLRLFVTRLQEERVTRAVIRGARLRGRNA